MPRQKTRTHATLACKHCQRKHERCEKLPGEDICTGCRKLNRFCISLPGNKRGPKPRRQNLGVVNPSLFSNVNPCRVTQTQHSHSVSRASYIQYQFTPGIENSSCLTPEVCTQYQLMPSVEIYLIPGMYQEQLTPSSLDHLYPVSGTTEVFQNTLTNQSSSTSFHSYSFAYEESALNIDRPTIIDPSTINLTSLSNPFNYIVSAKYSNT
ncbi:17777_t:CDS:1 [Cetraspora pellucida]|uniref:17777_t:CDS:1 n=1 Tax=Cetraspora pellucida TaxID=1433469 RepID=A0A9N9NZJ9_9GLOM|nr:17777_t:CDS:1 [Cetraspora pellucida]